ncbi:MAG: fimbrillin family protein [Bacteroidaceae bacterium]|nr:fimbrillin family protein [Bacteroidaceae bacterium]
MKKFLFFALTCALFIACDKQDSATFNETYDSAVSFKAFIKQTSRATETAFEDGDAISVFAVAPTAPTVSLEPSGNYADNVQYIYNGRSFDAGYNAITVSEKETVGLAYFAIYPYQSAASNKFTFNVKSDQSKYADYTASDLCTAYNEPTTENDVLLEFKHRLSCVAVKLYGENLVSKKISIKLNNVYTSCNVDINANTYTATGTTGSVIMGEQSNDTYQAIIAPQTVSSGKTFIVLTINGKETPLELAADVEFKSGKKITYEIELEDEKVIGLNGFIDPWNTADDLLTTVVPEEILEKINDHMPLYNGINPPSVEGAYLIEPFATVYCEDYPVSGYEPGHVVNSERILFSNQDASKNTLDYNSVTTSGSWEEGKGAFISGSGDNFTAFFNTEGESSDIYIKTALVISGTKTSSGIKDLYYAFVMVEKGDDPEEKLMDEGVFRVFKDEDGMSINCDWDWDYSNNATRSVAELAKSIYSNSKYFK